jgi:molybdenum cofactor guanylyltransferase
VPRNPPAAPDAARHCLILAGGRGQRIGGSKPLARLRGRALIDYPLAAALAAGLEPLVIAKPETELPSPLEATVLREPALPHHPLLGVATALARLDAPLVACPCDMPSLTGPLLAALAAVDGRPIVVCEHGGRLQPLLGRYSPEAAAPLRRAAEAGIAAASAVRSGGAAVLGDEFLGEFGEPAALLRNVNTAAELAALERAGS